MVLHQRDSQTLKREQSRSGTASETGANDDNIERTGRRLSLGVRLAVLRYADVFFSSALSMALSPACGRPIHGAAAEDYKWRHAIADRTIRAHKHDVARAASRHRQLRVKTVHLHQAASLPQPL